MYARTTTLPSNKDSIDAGIANVRDNVMSELQGIDGYVGLSLLVDRDSGRCIATTAWETEEAMRASDEAAREIRQRAAEAFGGEPDVAEWEIAVLHRDHQSREGACVRATWVKVEPDQIERGIDIFKMGVLPALDEHEGLCSVSLLVDRATGRGVSSVAYDSVEALQRNMDKIEELRSASAREASAEILDECNFELAIAHLHVPEMA
jgi:heme-degrading monooxygenase HmoA